MVEVSGLTKTFPAPDGGEKRAVDNVSFRIERGEIYGLLGPNGAGKTTTLRVLTGLLTPTAGAVRVNGADLRDNRDALKRSIGYLTASAGLYQRLTPRETLLYFGELHSLEPAAVARRAEQLIAWLDMASFADLRCGTLSTGQKQRTSIARALIADPPVLVLDEPTLGLDVISNRVMLEFIAAEGRRGKTIIFSTHYLDEAERLCDRFGLLYEGRLLADARLAELQARTGRQRLSDIFLALCGQSGAVLSLPKGELLAAAPGEGGA